MRRRDAELRAIAARRVQQIVGLVELQIDRHADQRIMLGALRRGHRVDIGELDDIRLCRPERDAAGQPAARSAARARPRRSRAGCDRRPACRWRSRRSPGNPDRWPRKSGRRKLARNPSICWPTFGGEPQIFGVAEQVAVFPEGAGAGALAGVVGEPDTDRAMQSLGRVDRHPHLFAGCRDRPSA